MLIICPSAGGNTVLGSITSPSQDLSSSLISSFLGSVFIANVETIAATVALKLLLQTWLSLGFSSRTSSALDLNHHASTPLSVRTSACTRHRQLHSFGIHCLPLSTSITESRRKVADRNLLENLIFSFSNSFKIRLCTISSLHMLSVLMYCLAFSVTVLVCVSQLR